MLAKVLVSKPASRTKAAPARARGATPDALALEYLDIKSAEDALAKRKEAMQSAVREAMTDGVLETRLGTFALSARKSYSWSLPIVREIMGDALYLGFVRADDKLLRVRASETDAIGCSLMATAQVAESESLIFKKA